MSSRSKLVIAGVSVLTAAAITYVTPSKYYCPILATMAVSYCVIRHPRVNTALGGWIERRYCASNHEARPSSDISDKFEDEIPRE